MVFELYKVLKKVWKPGWMTIIGHDHASSSALWMMMMLQACNSTFLRVFTHFRIHPVLVRIVMSRFVLVFIVLFLCRVSTSANLASKLHMHIQMIWECYRTCVVVRTVLFGAQAEKLAYELDQCFLVGLLACFRVFWG